MVVEKVLVRAEFGQIGRQWILFSVVQLWLLATGTGSAFAQVQLDRFFPPVITTGVQSAAVAEGKFPTWPPTVESSRQDIQIAIGKDSGKLEFTVPKDAAPGVAWIRFFDAESASQLIPILVSRFAVTEEKEPNNERQQANSLHLPAVVAGRLQAGGDSDCYRISVSQGRPLILSATANQLLRSPMDAVLQITDLRGNVLAQSDDQRGLDPQLVFTPAADQELLIRLFAFPSTPNSTVGFAGSPAYVYILNVTQGPFLDHAVVTGSETIPFGYHIDPGSTVQVQRGDQVSPPIASMPDTLGWCFLAGETFGESTYYREAFEAKLPVEVFGHIRRPKESHTVSFAARSGTKYRAEVRSKGDGFLLDSKLEAVEAKSGTVLASNDDQTRGGYDAAIEFTPKSDGQVDLNLTEMLEAFGPRHFYRLSIRPAVPAYKLSVASDRFVLASDKPLEIPVSIQREFGFAGKVEIKLQGLPAGVTCNPVISESKGETAKSVKLILKSVEIESGHHSIRVIGKQLDVPVDSKDADPSEAAITASFSVRPSIEVNDLWLTLKPTDKAKEQ